MSSISLDFTAAELMLPVLSCVAQGQVPPPEMLEPLVETPAFQLWFKHTNRHRPNDSQQFGPEAYYQVVQQAAAGETEHFLPRWLSQHASRAEQFAEMICQLKRVEIGTAAFQTANQYLPEPFDGSVNVYFYCATRGSAIVYDNNVVIDLADFPDPAVAPLPIAGLQAVLAHEIFHMGRMDLYQRGVIEGFAFNDLQEPLQQVAQLVAMLIEEGSATYFTTMALNRQMHGEKWQKLLDNATDICQRFADLLMRGLSRELSGEELLRQGLSFFGLEGYALGAKMCEAIETELGLESLQRALLKPRVFLTTYNKAVTIGKLNLPLISTELVTAVEEIKTANKSI